MKNILVPALTIISFVLPRTVFAAGTLGNICPTGNFGGLCGASGNSFGAAIGSFITFGFIIASVVALIFMVVGGIKWITANGDAKNIGAARDQIINALLGLVFVFLSYILVNVVLFFFAGTGLNSLTIPTFNAQ